VLTSPLLETKLNVPGLRRRLVERPRLLERLDQTSGAKLTLVSAPPGFGKSTLIASWLAKGAESRKHRVAWVSLEHADDEQAVFWTYVIEALRKALPGIGEGPLPLLDPSQPRVRTALAQLINELGSASGDVLLVLDDYHAIERPEIHEDVGFLLDHLPSSLHLVISTRADPPLALSRLRARGELAEIRAADLRFTAEEAAAYFRQVAGLDLGAGALEALEGRTEGWIAALQLAGLSMQGRDDVAEFIAGFAGDDRYIVDYLVEEVLQRQTDATRSFLLQTAVLARMTGSLCDAVTGQEHGRATLERLDRANLFLVRLDDRREWYRYHHLFADVLHARLLDERPQEVAALHRRAGEWHERNGDRSEAIRHAIAGKDFERAADLVELAMPETQRHRQDALRRTWLDALPAEVVRKRPVLSNLFAGTLLTHGATDGVGAHLDNAEAGLNGELGETRHADEAAFRNLRGSIAIHRAGLARLTGDVAGTIQHASAALDLIDARDDLGRGSASALLALARWESGELQAADHGYVEAMAHLQRAGYLADVVACSITLAEIRRTLGRLSDALAVYQRGLRMATESGASILRGAADMHVGIADVLRERNDLDGAREHLARAAELGDENGLPQNPYRSRLATARLRQATGDLRGAIEMAEEASRNYFTDFSPSVRPPSAVKARMLIVAGELDEAARWARGEGLSVDDEVTYVREFEHATLARLLVAQGAAARALPLLARMLAAAAAGDRRGSEIDLLVAQAQALGETGDERNAMASLGRALELGHQEGHVRVFLDEGRPVLELLRRVPRGGAIADAAAALLAAAESRAADRPVAATQGLVEPLSQRELDVLRLLAGDLDGPAIAAELFVSLNTVRTHTKNIYAKLGVNSRRAAVRRGADLGLLGTSGSPRPSA
jgi:LuxR family transcriptional regulator, maltose regulon positive regulatory protein